MVTDARGLSGSALGAFLRHEGLHKAQLTAWREAAETALGAPARTPTRWSGATRNWAPIAEVQLNPEHHPARQDARVA